MVSLRSDLDDLNLIISNIENIKIMEQIVKKDLEKGKKNFTELREIHDLKEFVIDKCKLLHLKLSEGNRILKILEPLMTDNTKRNKRSLLPLLGQTIGWVAGLATEGDVEKILHEIDYLTAKMKC